MVRTSLPGGLLTAGQYLALDALADAVTYNRSLRITTRQSLQFHGVLKDNLQRTIASINEAFITTLAACGDGLRNVVCSPAPFRSSAYDAVRELPARLAQEFRPETNAYNEIWLDGEKVDTDQEEPFYGPQYLPRKFKVGIALPDDNSIQVQTQDLGILAIVEEGHLQGFNLLVGGGMGLSHGSPDTFSRLGTPLGYIPADRAVEFVRAMVDLFRDHGSRSDRRHARLKYIIEDWGIGQFRDKVQERIDFQIAEPVDARPIRYNDYLGPHKQGDGLCFYGLHIENGRIIDRPNENIKSALREVVEDHEPRVIATPTQNLFLADLQEGAISDVEAVLEGHGVTLPDELSTVRRYSMACSGLPTCGMAIAASERVSSAIIDELEIALTRLGLDGAPLTVRVSGCANGCTRPYTADIALVGRREDAYDIYVGGSLHSHRLTDLYDELVQRANLVDSLRPLLEAWSRDRNETESLGDFYERRWGCSEPRTRLNGSKDDPARPDIIAGGE